MLANLNLMRQFVNRFQPQQRPSAPQQMPQQNMAAGGMLAPGLGMQAAMQQQYGAPGQTPMGVMAALARQQQGAQQAQPGAMANAFAQMQAGQGQGMLGGMQAPQGMGNILAQMMMARQQQGAQQGMGMGGLGMMGGLAGMFGGRNRR